MKEMIAYIRGGIASFAVDPAASPFQEGYKACLEEMLKVAVEMNGTPQGKVYRGRADREVL
jgi:hypothetical protein